LLGEHLVEFGRFLIQLSLNFVPRGSALLELAPKDCDGLLRIN